jgi:hypothetical protein
VRRRRDGTTTVSYTLEGDSVARRLDIDLDLQSRLSTFWGKNQHFNEGVKGSHLFRERRISFDLTYWLAVMALTGETISPSKLEENKCRREPP